MHVISDFRLFGISAPKGAVVFRQGRCGDFEGRVGAGVFGRSVLVHSSSAIISVILSNYIFMLRWGMEVSCKTKLKKTGAMVGTVEIEASDPVIRE